MELVLFIATIVLLMLFVSVVCSRSSKARHRAETQPIAKSAPTSSPSTAEPYHLKTNELPQGSYLVGRDIPPGTYDFFVVYGTGGKLDLCKRDASGKIIDGTWSFYWVGLKETYEKREVVHVMCEEGYLVKISGNVILRIAKSQSVKIDL